MKAKIKIIAMLMSMIIGTLTVSAQSARRGNSEQKRTSSTSKTYKKPTQKSNSSVARKPQAKNQVSRQATAQRTNKQQRSQPANTQRTSQNQRSKSTYTPRQSQSQRSNSTYSPRQSQAQRGNAVKTQRNTTNRGNAVNTAQRNSKQQPNAQRGSTHKMSTSNRNNPRSTYRTPESTARVGKTYVNPKTANRQGYQPAVRDKYHNETHFYKNSTAHYRHHYYPAKKVKIHVHPMTYRGNYRALYYPRYSEIVWNRSMHRHYNTLYPHYTGWHYNWGYRIQTMSAFEAEFNVGEIARVYGRVYATWYNQATDDLLLFFGGEYPHQVFTMVVPGNVARRYSWRPERYFLGQHVSATGLITMFEGKAEMVLKKRSQMNVY